MLQFELPPNIDEGWLMVLEKVNKGMMLAINRGNETGAGTEKTQKSLAKYYRQAARKFSIFLVDRDRVLEENLSPELMRDYAHWLNTPNDSHRLGVLSTQSQDTYLEGLRAILQRLVETDELEENPLDNIKSPKTNNVHKVKAISHEHRLAMLKRSRRSYRDQANLMQYAYTGARLDELCSATIFDIDHERKRMSIRGKGHKNRTLYISEEAYNALKNYLEFRPKSKYNNIFLQERRPFAKLGPSGMAKIFEKYSNECMIPPPNRPHSFRHRLARDWREAGMTIDIISKLLGHSDIK